MAPANVSTGGLPEKEWFSLAEISERWGCSEHHLIHLAGQGTLRLGVVADGWIVDLYGIDDDDALPSLEDLCCIGFVTVPVTTLALLEQGDGQFMRWIEPPLEHEPGIPIRSWFCMDNVGGVREVAITTCQGSRFHRVDTSPAHPLIHQRDLCMLRVERDRFEREWRVGAYAGAMPDAEQGEQLDPRERTTYRQLVALMVADMNLPTDQPYKAAECLEEKAAQHRLEVRSRETLAKLIRELDQ